MNEPTEPTDDKEGDEIQAMMDQLVAEGEFYRTGEYRPDGHGNLRPVYKITELGLNKAAGDRGLN
jgi:hypothetical protein